MLEVQRLQHRDYKLHITYDSENILFRRFNSLFLLQYEIGYSHVHVNLNKKPVFTVNEHPPQVTFALNHHLNADHLSVLSIAWCPCVSM